MDINGVENAAITCFMLYALCFMLYALCFMLYVLAMTGASLLNIANAQPVIFHQVGTIDDAGSAGQDRRQPSRDALAIFFLSTCPRCQKMAPIVKRYAARHGDKVHAFSLDGGSLPDFPHPLPALPAIRRAFLGQGALSKARPYCKLFNNIIQSEIIIMKIVWNPGSYSVYLKTFVLLMTLVLPFWGEADIQNSLVNYLDSMGFSGNATSASAYQGQEAGYYSAGSEYLRNSSIRLSISILSGNP